MNQENLINMNEVGLQSILVQAAKEHRAIGHFNVSDLAMLHGIMAGAKATGTVAIMIGTSEGEANFFGYAEMVAVIGAVRERYGTPVFLNADHHKSVEAAKRAIDAGYDSVHIDLSKLSYKDNLNGTKEVVDYAREYNAQISVEGELGYLPTDSSKIYKEEVRIDPASLTKPEEAAEFVERTGINRFAAAIGNLHGIAANEPQLDLERIKQIRKALPDDVAFVLHGGSGIPDTQIHEAIALGMNNVHISTELRVAYMEALRKSLQEKPSETTPYKLFPPAVEAVQKVVEEKLKSFDPIEVGLQ